LIFVVVSVESVVGVRVGGRAAIDSGGASRVPNRILATNPPVSRCIVYVVVVVAAIIFLAPTMTMTTMGVHNVPILAVVEFMVIVVVVVVVTDDKTAAAAVPEVNVVHGLARIHARIDAAPARTR
jgi:hypothetical protein